MIINNIIGKGKYYEAPFDIYFNDEMDFAEVRDAYNSIVTTISSETEIENVIALHICDLLNREHCRDGHISMKNQMDKALIHNLLTKVEGGNRTNTARALDNPKRELDIKELCKIVAGTDSISELIKNNLSVHNVNSDTAHILKVILDICELFNLYTNENR